MFSFQDYTVIIIIMDPDRDSSFFDDKTEETINFFRSQNSAFKNFPTFQSGYGSGFCPLKNTQHLDGFHQ
jgi:hypothetical protein